MSSIPLDLSRIRAFVLDVDGVLSNAVVPLGGDGVPLRTGHVKDGFAIRLAVCRGYIVAIITGGDNSVTAKRMAHLGVKDFFNCSRNKFAHYTMLKKKYCLEDEEVVYIGDDLPDLEVMKHCGLPVAPRDAAPEVLDVAKYVSPYEGGRGVVRDVIEQVLRAQDNWHLDEVDMNW